MLFERDQGQHLGSEKNVVLRGNPRQLSDEQLYMDVGKDLRTIGFPKGEAKSDVSSDPGPESRKCHEP